MKASRAAFLASGVVAASRAALKVALADSIAGFAVATALWRATCAALCAAFAASNAAFCSGVYATFFTTGVVGSAACAPVTPASAKSPAVVTTAIVRFNMIMKFLISSTTVCG